MILFALIVSLVAIIALLFAAAFLLDKIEANKAFQAKLSRTLKGGEK
jgi:flagellar biogenesis protein FliO